MLKALKQDGFASFVEVVITAVIFMIAAFGIFSAISMLRPHGVESAKKLQAAYVALGVYSTLRGKVDADYWDNASGFLAVNVVHTNTFINIYPSGNYQVNWILTDDPLGIRRLEMNVEEL